MSVTEGNVDLVLAEYMLHRIGIGVIFAKFAVVCYLESQMLWFPGRRLS